MTPEAASKVSLLAETLKVCAEAIEAEDWEAVKENAEEVSRLARWLQLSDEP